jgi:acetone carboxylase gamma subunit
MSHSISPTLDIRKTAAGETICCRNCGQPLVPTGRPWKPFVIVHELPTDGPSCRFETGAAATILRLFVCGGCGALLDSETALPGEPFLEDIVKV